MNSACELLPGEGGISPFSLEQILCTDWLLSNFLEEAVCKEEAYPCIAFNEGYLSCVFCCSIDEKGNLKNVSGRVIERGSCSNVGDVIETEEEQVIT